ncbi:MAG: PLP-dependent aminotransferase family protein, partial [Burkholderiaceae bacterium]|nr:PLP-dependent aminotransferase family protein [Burkholderiaceae bacterium]
MKLYEALAQEIEDLVAQQALRPGDRLPSVRQQQARRGVSPATVFQAYYLLEARGVIESRPRSGYYVARLRLPDGTPPEPQASRPAVDAAVVDVSALVFAVLEAARNRSAVPFGSAFPSPLLFPLARLARDTASAMRRLDPWSTVADLAPGNDDLRRQIALRYQLDGAPVSPDDIVITNGAMEALNLCLQAVTRPGDTVLVESPAFYAALQALERLGLHAVEVATDPRDGMDLDALAAALARHQPAACWLMTSFQNPLGSLMSPEKKQALVALLAR